MKDPQSDATREERPFPPGAAERPTGWRRVSVDPGHPRFEPARSIDPTPPPWTHRRREPRVPTRLRARTTTVDPVRDPVTRALHYQTNEDDGVLDVSRRGLRLRCARPPLVGTRMLMQFQLPGDSRVVELIGCARWTRVEFVPGELGARATAAVGIELVGGSHASLTHYEQGLVALERGPRSLATQKGVR